jgi:hypothetical protein
MFARNPFEFSEGEFAHLPDDRLVVIRGRNIGRTSDLPRYLVEVIEGETIGRRFIVGERELEAL